MWNAIYGADIALYFIFAVIFGSIGPNLLALYVLVHFSGPFTTQVLITVVGIYAIYITTRYCLLRFLRALRV